MRLQAFRAAVLAVITCTGVVAAAQAPATTASPALHSSRASRPHVKVAPATGPPTSTVKVSGTGFGGFKAVDIYFDNTDKALAATNGTGAFSGIAIKVPASARPGTHYITAVQRHSGRSAQARFLVNTNWAQFRYSLSHAGFNPYENVLTPGNVSGLDKAWSYTTGNNVFSSPAVANGVVYVGSDDGNVYALNAATGAELWSFKTGSTVESSPAVANGVVYIGSDDHNVYALNAATGAKLWSFATGAAVESSPAVANGVVYVGSDDDSVYALNAATGLRLWSFTTELPVVSSPAVANGVIYIAGHDGNLYAFHLSDGLASASRPAPGQLHPSHGLQPVR